MLDFDTLHLYLQMRIISGIYKGRTLELPRNLPVRPTTDFARTGLFNMLNSRIHFDEIAAIDLFCGTGAISFELASRGCHDITAVDSNRLCTKHIQHTIDKWKVKGMRVLTEDVFKFVEFTSINADFIFADPPYALKALSMLPELIFKNNLLRDEGMFILEHGADHSFENIPHFIETRNYGNVNFSIFQK